MNLLFSAAVHVSVSGLALEGHYTALVTWQGQPCATPRLLPSNRPLPTGQCLLHLTSQASAQNLLNITSKQVADAREEPTQT